MAERIREQLAGPRSITYDMSRFNWDHIARQTVNEVYRPLAFRCAAETATNCATPPTASDEDFQEMAVR
jgi:hypothetical protein